MTFGRMTAIAALSVFGTTAGTGIALAADIAVIEPAPRYVYVAPAPVAAPRYVVREPVPVVVPAPRYIVVVPAPAYQGSYLTQRHHRPLVATTYPFDPYPNELVSSVTYPEPGCPLDRYGYERCY